MIIVWLVLWPHPSSRFKMYISFIVNIKNIFDWLASFYLQKCLFLSAEPCAVLQNHSRNKQIWDVKFFVWVDGCVCVFVSSDNFIW